MRANAVVLLSGGLDSTTTLAIARQAGYHCHALSFDYGQRHHIELDAAERIARSMQVTRHKIIRIDLTQIGGSALTDADIAVPQSEQPESETAGAGGRRPSDIPVTYVPARNTIFLSLALAYAEVIEALDIFIGVNAVDYSGYPDCRPEYIRAFAKTANLATRAGVEGADYRIHTPLINLSKAGIIRQGYELNVDYALTVSCYQANERGQACGKCDSCRLRRQGFIDADLPDPTNYQ